MVKHIVLFKIKKEYEETKAATCLELKKVLDVLPSKIDFIRSFETGINFLDTERAFDVSLVSAFDSKSDLDNYQNHPEHLLVVTRVKELIERSVAVDYEL